MPNQDSVVNNGLQLPPGFQYTQANLQNFLDCPRRFYLKYIEGQRWPAPVTVPQEAYEAAMRRGQLIHQIIERHQTGIDLDTLQTPFTDDEDLQRWLIRYRALLPELVGYQPALAEVRLSAQLSGHHLLAKFDWLGFKDGQLTAIDWKTGNLPSAERLTRRMQTILYLLILYRSGAALVQRDVESYVLRYISLETGEQRLFTVTSGSIVTLERQVLEVIEAIQTSDYKKVASERPCRFCVYRGLCGRGQAPHIDDATFEWDDTVGTIELNNPEMVEF
jgi:RecB family exonuclease